MTRFACDSARLHDHADGTLGADERAAVDAHLPTCAACRAELARIVALRRRASEAPRAVEPARDLWPELRSRLVARGAPGAAAPGERTARRVPTWSAGSWAGWRLRAAAGIAIAVASSAATVALLRARDGRGVEHVLPPPAGVAQAPAPAAAPLAVTASYERTARDLAATLAAQRQTLAPATVATVEAALRVADSAIAEGRAALARDPGNSMIAELLVVTYRQKVDVLRRATELPAGS